MPTQKTFKRRVRVRMTKTGESYTSARRQLLREPVLREPADPADPPAAGPDSPVVRATGRGLEAWFWTLDAWGAVGRGHTAIATHLRDELGVPGWWAQNITVEYERARGLRAVHQQADGFTVSASRTVGVGAETALAAFTDPDRRARWLPDVAIAARPTRAANTARFDWPEPPSRIVVNITPRAGGRCTVNVAHEKLPDAQRAEEAKLAWRTRLGALRTYLES